MDEHKFSVFGLHLDFSKFKYYIFNGQKNNIPERCFCLCIVTFPGKNFLSWQENFCKNINCPSQNDLSLFKEECKAFLKYLQNMHLQNNIFAK